MNQPGVTIALTVAVVDRRSRDRGMNGLEEK